MPGRPSGPANQGGGVGSMARSLLLILLVNFLPLALGVILGRQGALPLDGGRLWKDGRPILGPHKTVRGVAMAIGGGTILGWLLGYPFQIGCAVGAAAMVGDLLTSFFKRRSGQASGADSPGKDQFLEALLPLLVLRQTGFISWPSAFIALFLFCVSAYLFSQLYRLVFIKPTHGASFRDPTAINRMREFVRCRVRSPWMVPIVNYKESLLYGLLVIWVLRLLGLLDHCRKQALDVHLRHETLAFDDLPEGFDGYRILFMTDMHLDGCPGLTDVLGGIAKQADADLCLLGGDYRYGTAGPIEPSMGELSRLLGAVNVCDGVVGVLGNHDCPEMVDYMAELGVRVLMNEAVAVRRDGETLWIAGVDDPRYFRAARPTKAMAQVPLGGFCIFLAHAPEVYDQAARLGARLYLCGHTHGGQIGLPGMEAPFTHSKAPRRVCKGHWREGVMQGFTSVGAGVSGAPVRLGTKGEMLLLTLRRQPVLAGVM